VFVGEYPAFDAGFGGELQDDEGAGGPFGPSVEQSLHGGDGVVRRPGRGSPGQPSSGSVRPLVALVDQPYALSKHRPSACGELVDAA
jgi:hypothetical protein